MPASFKYVVCKIWLISSDCSLISGILDTFEIRFTFFTKSVLPFVYFLPAKNANSISYIKASNRTAVISSSSGKIKCANSWLIIKLSSYDKVT